MNCETAIQQSDEFCSNCGQENRNLKISFWELITEFLSSNFNFDTKLGRTIVDLLFKPGEITKQFNLGKRKRYVKPIQMYLFVSFIYFLLAGVDPPSFVNTTPPSQSEIDALNKSEIVDINIDNTDLAEISESFKNVNPDNDSEIDSMLLQLGETDITPFTRHIARQGIRSLRDNNEEALTKEVYANLSIALFFLLPIFAGLLWLLTKKASPFYIDSIVFSIHFHTVVLFVFSVNMLVGFLFDEETVFKIALALIIAYLAIAIKRLYSLSWKATVGKTLALAFSYSVVFGISYLLVLILSFWAY